MSNHARKHSLLTTTPWHPSIPSYSPQGREIAKLDEVAALIRQKGIQNSLNGFRLHIRGEQHIITVLHSKDKLPAGALYYTAEIFIAKEVYRAALTWPLIDPTSQQGNAILSLEQVKEWSRRTEDRRKDRLLKGFDFYVTHWNMDAPFVASHFVVPCLCPITNDKAVRCETESLKIGTADFESVRHLDPSPWKRRRLTQPVSPSDASDSERQSQSEPDSSLQGVMINEPKGWYDVKISLHPKWRGDNHT